MLFKKVLFLLFLLLICGLESQSKVVEKFTKMRTWKQAPSTFVPSGKYGLSLAKFKRPARMWFKGTSDVRDMYGWIGYGLNYDVSNSDYLVLKYKLTRKGSITIDIWFDNKMVFPRPIGYLPGTGEWAELVIPVRGKKVTKMTIGITEGNFHGANKIYEVFLKEMRTANKAEVEAIKKSAVESKKKSESGEWVKEARKTLDAEEKKTLQNKTTVNNAYVAQGIVIPTPKKMKFSNKKLKLSSGDKALCSILLSKKASETDKIAAKELAEAISKLAGISIDKIKINNEKKYLNTPVIFVLGEKLSLFDKFKVIPPRKKEGYVIKTVKDKDTELVLCRGRDKTGVYWAVQTLKQLMQKQNDALTMPEGEIIDWPVYTFRSTTIHPDNMLANARAMSYKINTFLEPWFKLGTWDQQSQGYKNRIRKEVDYFSKRGVNVAHEISPFHHSRKGAKGSIRCSNPKDVDKLFNTYKISLERGNKVITLAFDDATREKESFRPVDRKFFNGDQIKSHAYLTAELAKRLKKEYPDAIICVTPKSYQTSNDVKKYYNAAGVPKSVIIQWTGNSTITTDFKRAAVRQFKKDIEGRRFIIFDNTPGRKRGILMFDYYASGYKALAKENCYGISPLLRWGYPASHPELTDITGMTIAEYMWNADRYKAKTVVRKVLVKVAGKAAVKPLLEFKKHFLVIASSCPIEKTVAKLSATYKKRYKLSEADYKELEPEIISAGKALIKVQKTCKNNKLTRELEAAYIQMINIVKALL